MQTKDVKLTRNDLKLLKRALSMYRNRKASISTKEFNICKSLWKYLDDHQHDTDNT